MVLLREFCLSQDPSVPFPQPTSQMAKAALMARGAESRKASLSFSFMPAKFCHGAFDADGKAKSGDFSQLEWPPRLSVRMPLLLSVQTKLSAAPRHLHTGSASVPLHRLGSGCNTLPVFLTWEVQPKCALVPTVTPSLDALLCLPGAPAAPCNI